MSRKFKFSDFSPRELIRPIVYRLFTRAVYGTVVGLLWREFVNKDGSWAAYLTFLGIVLLFSAFLCYLHLDGLSTPRLKKLTGAVQKKRKAFQQRGDIADFTDTPISTPEDISDEEEDFCAMIADVAIGVLALVLSLIV